MERFKAAPYEGEIVPCGYWVVIREAFEGDGWCVVVYDFANWKHRWYKFGTEAEARTEFMRWTL